MTEGLNFDLFRAGPNAMVLVNPQGSIVDANQAALSLFGWNDLVGRQVEELVPLGVRGRHQSNRDSFFC